MIEAILNFMFPPHCPLCGAYVEEKGSWCPQCLIKALQPQRLPLPVPVQVVIDNAWALSVYRGGTQDLIRGLKYHGRRNSLPYICTLLDQAAENPAVAAVLSSVSLAVPVPLYREKEKRRGFNQTELIFRDWLQDRGIPMQKALQRIRATRPMYQLSAEERQHNLQGAFRVTEDTVLAGKRILLVDDIMTTGATLYACARELRQSGAVSVTALVLASDHR
ncbi:MAG: ComF family protein [Selenomonas sp.]|nr:ComF family protein [Selenomonas sp.]